MKQRKLLWVRKRQNQEKVPRGLVIPEEAGAISEESEESPEDAGVVSKEPEGKTEKNDSQEAESKDNK